MSLNTDKIITYWKEVLEVLKNIVSDNIFENHLKTIDIETIDDIIYLNAANELSANIIDTNYSKIIKEIFTKKLGFSPNIFIKSKIKIQPTESETTVQKKPKRQNQMDEISLPLNPEYCFETFIVGNHNKLANACGENVSSKPGKGYNPLFIYGASGLGKTHLMQAIGNRLKELNPYAKIFYTTGENFTSLYVDAVRENKLQSLRKKIRSYDLFLLDDIQFLLNKEGTLTEFFHTFNALFESNKQIVLTSDRAPKDLDMDERLLSRFEQGMFTDIKKPDFETRLAILKEKILNENMTFTDDVLDYIARLITDNIRKMQGALIKLIAEASLLKQEITVDFAKKILDKYYNDKTPAPIIDVNLIQQKCCEYFKVSVGDLIGLSRTKDLVLARQVAMYLSRDLTEMSLPAIGKAFGGKDHTTVIHACKKIEKRLQEEPGFREQINEISSHIIQ